MAAFRLHRGCVSSPGNRFIVMLPLLSGIRRYAAPETSFLLLAWVAIAANPQYSLELSGTTIGSRAAGGQHRVSMIGRHESLQRTVGRGERRGSAVCPCFCGLRRRGLSRVWALIIGRTQWIAFGGGVAAILVPYSDRQTTSTSVIMLGPHTSAVLAPLQSNFLGARWQRSYTWLWPD